MNCRKCGRELVADYEFGTRALYYCQSCNWINIDYDTCGHTKKRVRYTSESGHKSTREQCIDCGLVFGTMLKKIPGEDIPDYDEWAADRIVQYNNHFDQESERMVLDFRAKNKEIWNKEHNKYLGSKEWMSLRNKVLARDNHICQGCLINIATQVHHKTYQNWRAELAFELISLCLPCHTRLHSTK